MGVGGGSGGSGEDEAFFHCVWVGLCLVGLSPRWEQGAGEVFAVQAWVMLPGVPYRCSLSPVCGTRLLALFLGHDRNCAGGHLCQLGQTSAPTS